jgi:serine protease Do
VRSPIAIITICLASLAAVDAALAADDLARLEQQALNAGAEAVAPSVVQIRTVGGLDRVEEQAAAQGPTTGLIVDADGYIVSSAFNFAQEPTSILVRLPRGEQRPAEIVGRDNNRMLVLLKVEADEPLPIPKAFDADEVSISVGVVSALNRIHGRALQTDANVSASNYGGPLVDVQGRVLGVLVPMSPQAGGAGEVSAVAGSEFYDSGIGFAVPLEHVLSMLDRWKEEKDLNRGLLGISLKPGNPHATPATVTAIWPRSPAAAAGWKPKDRIVAVDGEPIESQTDLRFHIARHYAGDKLAVTLRRGNGDEAKELKTTVTLSDELPAYQHAFLGILPERQAPEGDKEGEDADDKAPEGVVVRAVWPDSPADRAGIQSGDRIIRLGSENVQTLGEAVAQLNAKSPDDELPVKLLRDEEELEFDIELTDLPTEILSASDLPSAGNETDSNEDEELKLEELKLPEMPQTARYIKSDEDGPQPGLLIWLGASGEESANSLADSWQRTCRRDRLVLLMPEPAAAGWSRDDLEYLARLLQTAVRRFNADPRRIVVAGEGKGGQLAYALGFGARKLVRGVVAVDSPLPRTLELPDNSPNERLAILTIESPDTPLSILMRQDRQKLAEAGYPATQVSRRGNDDAPAPLDSTTRAKVARWIDALDRF